MTSLSQLLEMGKSMRILYVEDDEALQQELTLLLSDIFDTIILASNGKEGLEAFKNESFDLVITDIRMPLMDGITMIEAIRQISPRQPIVVTSAHNEVEYLIKLIHLGVDSFITKPLSSDLIIETLAKSVQHIYEAKELHRQTKEIEEYEKNIEMRVTQGSQQLKNDFLYTKAFKEAYEHVGNIIVVNIEGKIIECSKNMANLLCCDVNELINTNLKDCLHVKSAFHDFGPILKKTKNLLSWQGEVVLIDKSMQTHYGMITIAILNLESEDDKFLINIQETTKWRTLLRDKDYELEHIIERYSLAKCIESIPLPAVILDNQGVITYANPEVIDLIEEGLDGGKMRKMYNGELHLWDFVNFIDEDLIDTQVWQRDKITQCEAKYETILGTVNVHIKIKSLTHENGAFMALFCYQGFGDDAL